MWGVGWDWLCHANATVLAIQRSNGKNWRIKNMEAYLFGVLALAANPHAEREGSVLEQSQRLLQCLIISSLQKHNGLFYFRTHLAKCNICGGTEHTEQWVRLGGDWNVRGLCHRLPMDDELIRHYFGPEVACMGSGPPLNNDDLRQDELAAAKSRTGPALKSFQTLLSFSCPITIPKRSF